MLMRSCDRLVHLDQRKHFGIRDFGDGFTRIEEREFHKEAQAGNLCAKLLDQLHLRFGGAAVATRSSTISTTSSGSMASR